MYRRIFYTILVAAVLAPSGRAVSNLPDGAPAATIDLTTPQGVALVDGQWRYSDTRIVEVDFKTPGPDGQPTGRPLKTYDVEPHAGWADFDDSDWPVIDPARLQDRRSTGKVCFNWYRIRLTIPERIDGFDPTGATVVLETSIDDYAEVWVDGEIPREAGESGGSVIQGWNAVNRLVIGRNVAPGQKIQLAVFGVNGPISSSPTNFIWMRLAKVDFYPESDREPRATTPHEVNVEVTRLDPAIDAIVPPNPKIFKLAEGFEFLEGPVWLAEGFLLFSDPNANRVYKYVPDGDLTVFREKSGYDGADIDDYTQPGSNGLAVDRQGRLTIAEHGNRRVTRLDGDGRLAVLADRYEGRRLNSPNDLVYKSDGALYFTDPPFGLPEFFDDSRKELPFSGVYRLAGGRLELMTTELTGPNGLAFSPDERYLYVDNWDTNRKIVMRYAVDVGGKLRDGRVFFDMTGAPGEEALDGLKVDEQGNLYVSGPGGIWVLSKEGRHLGTIRVPRLPANFAFGDADRKTLYMTARSALYRMRLMIPGTPHGSANMESHR